MEAAHRLRDLGRPARIAAVLVGLLLLVPVGTSVGRALSVEWRPSNDDALIVLRARDVLGADPPLVGQPSTAQDHVEDNQARHPGPIEFYVLAVPIRVLGHIHGTLLTTAAIAGGSVLLTAWIALRRGGPAVGLGAAVLLGLAMWSSGTAVLSDPISSNVGGYPLIAGSALAWSAWRDDRRLWPLAAAVWSFTVQQHLAIFGVAGLVAAWGVVGAVATTVAHRHEAGRPASAARWAAAAITVAAVCWAPPLYDQVRGQGNLGELLDYSSTSDRATLGVPAGLRAAGRAVAAPPLLLSRELALDHQGGGELTEALGSDAPGVALGVVAGLGAVAASAARWRRTGDRAALDRLALLGTAAVVAGGGIVTAANVPFTFEATRINFYRWVWPVALAVWGSVLWCVAEAVLRHRPLARWRPPAVAAAIGLLAVIAVATSVVVDGGDRRRDQQVFRFEAETEAAVRNAVPTDVPVRLVMIGRSAFVAQGPALAAALVEDGYEVRVDPELAPGFGDRRATRRKGGGEALVQVLSDQGTPPPGVGERVARATLPSEPGGVDNSWTDDTFEVWVDLP